MKNKIVPRLLRRGKKTWALGLGALALGVLVSCGGGGGGSNGGGTGSGSGSDTGPTPVLASCKPSVKPGDATGGYVDGNGRSSGEGGNGGGDAGAAGGDAGAGLGRFLHALVDVELADGSLAGSAEIDDTRGVVKFVLCDYQGPVHLRVRGKPDNTTQYFDESVQKYVPFPPGQEMNAVVPRLERNIGITILTEASWRYLLAKYGPEGWHSAAHVSEANEAIRVEFNRYLPAALQIADITRLPVLYSDTTTPGSVPSTPNGTYGIVNSGLARAAGLLLAGQPDAALKLAQQMGADLCDGVLDYACNGRPVVADASEAAYLLPQLGGFLNGGVGDVATSCGAQPVSDASMRITQMRVDFLYYPGGENAISTAVIWYLRNDGRLFVSPTRGSALREYAPTLRFRQLFNQGPLLGTTFDGKAYRFEYRIALGTKPPLPFVPPEPTKLSADPQPPVEVPGYAGVSAIAALSDPDMTQSDASSPVWPRPGTVVTEVLRLPNGHAYLGAGGGVPVDTGLGNVVQTGIAGPGSLGYFAVTADGGLYAWGANALGQLGLGRTDTELPTQATPARVTFPSGVGLVSVAGRTGGAYAIDRTGEVWGWGATVAIGSTVLPTRTAPVRLNLLDAFKPIRQMACAMGTNKCVVLSESGKMVVWGTFPDNIIGPNISMAPTEVAAPAGRRFLQVASAGRAVYGLLDDGRLVAVLDLPSNPTVIEPTVLPAGTGQVCRP